MKYYTVNIIFYYFSIFNIILDDFINSNNSAISEDILFGPADNVTANEFSISPAVIPEVLADNLTCPIDTMEELQKYIDTSNKTFLLN